MTLKPLPKETLAYVNKFGGNCRDCADNRGVCPVSGLPCAERGKAIKYVIEAINYGAQHGFLKISAPDQTEPAMWEVTDPGHETTTTRDSQVAELWRKIGLRVRALYAEGGQS